MIPITQTLARQVQALLRASVPLGARYVQRPKLEFHTGQDGLRLRIHLPEVAVEFHLAGSLPADNIILPGEALDDFARWPQAVIRLENSSSDTVQIRWEEGGVPQVRAYPAIDPRTVPPFPLAPPRAASLEPHFFRALGDAVQTAARDDLRSPASRLHLCGARGELIATDRRQLLIQGGFPFPWRAMILIPAVDVLACRDLPQDGPVSMGKSATHVSVDIGPWKFFLPFEREGPCPWIRSAVPLLDRGSTFWCLSAADAAFLAQALPHLLGQGEEPAAVTIELNEPVAVRARARGKGQTIEVILTHSRVSGPPVQLVSARSYLGRALQLGFTVFQVSGLDEPVVCRERGRTYAWMPLGSSAALPPSPDTLQIASEPPRSLN